MAGKRARLSGSAFSLLAAAQVTAAGAFTGKVLGFASVAVVAGVYTLVLSGTTGQSHNIDPTTALLVVTPLTDAQFVTADQTNDTTVVVKGWNAAGMATATAFHVAVWRKFTN